ncbi:MAG: hypothetical protein D6718_12530 [Acidobacteria bacterium]|nr:MAG: hypothetical protein D6718_12530 [Acidobacteriota bacterium]
MAGTYRPVDQSRRSGPRSQRFAGARGLRRPRPRPRLAGTGGILLAALLSLAPVAGIARERPDPARPRDGADLLQRIAAGETVVLARVERRGAKARLAVEEVLRGTGVGETIRIAFRGDNLARPPGTPPFDPVEGEEAFWVLERYTDSAGDPVADDLFRPAAGYASRIPIPAEGARALDEAVREIVRYQDRPDRGAAEAQLVAWLSGTNPWLIDAALREASRFGLADEAWIPGLLAHARDASPERRRWALRAIGLALERGRLEPRRTLRPRPDEIESAGELVRACRELIVRLARTDESAEVRAEAVRLLPRAGVPEARRILEAIADEDPAQEVRYEAAAGLYRLGRSREAGSPNPAPR